MVLACCVRKRVSRDVEDVPYLELEDAYLTAESYRNVVLISAGQGDYNGWSELSAIDVESLITWLTTWLESAKADQ